MGEFGRLQASSDLDQMFSMVEKKPYQNEVIGQATEVPLQGGGIVDDIYAPPAWEYQFSGGCVNGNFIQGPNEATDPIDDIGNKLPGWTTGTVQGSSISFTHIADMDSPYGYSIQVDATDCTADDEVYLQQIVPVKALERVIQCWAMFGDDDTEADFSYRIKLQGLASDLTTVGSEDDGEEFTSSSTVTRKAGSTLLRLDGTVCYVRVRIHFYATDATSGTHTTYLRQVVVRPPNVFYTTVAFSRTTDFDANGTVQVFAVTDNANGTPDVGAGWYVAPLAGWVEAISVKLHDDGTSGTLVFQAFKNVTSSPIGPSASVHHTDVGAGYVGGGNEVYNSSTNLFAAEDQIRVMATGSSWSPIGRDALVIVTMALVPDYPTSGWL